VYINEKKNDKKKKQKSNIYCTFCFFVSYVLLLHFTTHPHTHNTVTRMYFQSKRKMKNNGHTYIRICMRVFVSKIHTYICICMQYRKKALLTSKRIYGNTYLFVVFTHCLI